MYGLLRVIIPIYMLGAVGLFLVALSHLLFSGFDARNNPAESRLGLFGTRVFCAIFWPFILLSVPGRKFMFASVKGLFSK